MVVGENNLKLCPFCGGEVDIKVNFAYFWVECTKCGAVGKVHMVLSEDSNIGMLFASNSWNTRPIEDDLNAEINVLKDRINELEQENDYITSAFERSETIDHQGNLRGSIVALEKTIENLQVELEHSKTDYELLSDDYKQLETAIQQGLLRNRKIQMTHKKYGDATIIRTFQVNRVYWVRAAVDGHLMVETPMSEWKLKDFSK